jgi:tetratricopeptide (TPR) repeat protein
MGDEERFSEEEAQRHFAVKLNNQVWELLEKPDRSRQDDELMLLAAHASYYHWLQVGTAVHQQRGEWLIARVYTTLGDAPAALRHAARCLKLTQEYAGVMADFDVAFAYESVARANAAAGNLEKAMHYAQLAEQAGQAIVDEDDRRIFLDDFYGGEWNGVRHDE